MATKNEKTGGAAVLTAPEGTSASAAKHYAKGVAQRFDALPPQGAVRLLLVARKGVDDAEVRAALSNPRMGLKKKAPSVFEALLTLADMEAKVGALVGEGKMFRWVDLAHRCYGAPAASEAEVVKVAVAYDGTPADAKKKLTSLGVTVEERAAPPEAADVEGGWVDEDEGLVTGTIAGAKVVDLVMTSKVLSIEVRAARPAEEPEAE